MSTEGSAYILEGVRLGQLSYLDILKQSTEAVEGYRRGVLDLQPVEISLGFGVFMNTSIHSEFPPVTVTQLLESLVLTCPCATPKRRMCRHQTEVLLNIIDRPELRIFFDERFRMERLRQFAVDYGLAEQPNLDEHFEVTYEGNTIQFAPKSKELLPLNAQWLETIQQQLLPTKMPRAESSLEQDGEVQPIIVLRRHKFYQDQLLVELYRAPFAKNGQPKAPFQAIDPHGEIWGLADLNAAKFLIAVAKYQGTEGARNIETNLQVLRVIVQNPMEFPVYVQPGPGTDKVAATSLVPVRLQAMEADARLRVEEQGATMEVSAELLAEGRTLQLEAQEWEMEYFLKRGNVLNLITNPATLRVVQFMRKHHNKLLIHRSKFAEFKNGVLKTLERYVQVLYPNLPLATPVQLRSKGFTDRRERIIYLSEEGNFVALTPVVRYGNVEVEVYSERQIRDIDEDGKEFKVERDSVYEVAFTALIMQQHPDFEEQLQEMEYFYLHKKKFMDEDWFLEAFATWQAEGITIHGFNKLKKHNLSFEKANVVVRVSSDINWFNVKLKVQFGKQQASLKALKKSVKNKSKYVQLDDGTIGILPAEWLEKFAQYFQSGDLVDGGFRTPKSRWVEVQELFEDEVLDQEVRTELALYQAKFNDFQGIANVEVPAALQTALREYQHQGFNWLCFLDQFNFGGCLADDMGLGKTVMVIALLLRQRELHPGKANLVVLPTSLLFNWQEELARFAPSLKVLTYHGADRKLPADGWDSQDIVLTTYGTMQSDVTVLRLHAFNYIILDESQAIKNPDSLRNRSARLLQARNRLVLTGTPLENNLWDIYGQLSFACPGLLGSSDHFRFIYSNPIERFGDNGRARTLQRIIHPFILRRTKAQVARDLPERTEMVIHCEMPPDQRKVYDDYEAELRRYIEEKNNPDIPREAMKILKGLTKLRQICDSPLLLKDGVIHETASAKVEMLVQQISEHSPDHKILIFSQFVEMLELIQKALVKNGIPHTMLTGQTRNRAAKVHEFQENEATRVFLLSLKAGGTGLNLTAADYVYLVDPWWNPAVENQAIDRAHRIGQQRHVVAVRLICPNTVEEKVLRLQATKLRIAEAMIRTDSTVLKALSKEDLLSMLR